MSEFAGGLSERVRFERREDVRGVAGDLRGDWRLCFERWAKVEPHSRASNSVNAADALHSARRWKLTLRAGVEPSLEMRVLWRGRTLKLTGIEMDPAEPDRLRIWAEDSNI